jgi:hypothetical protein
MLRRINESPLGIRFISADVVAAGPQAAGYAGMHAKLEQGFAILQRLAGRAEARP